MDQISINHLAVLAAALSGFLVGGLWYSPLLFQKSWMKCSAITEEKLNTGNPAVIFGVSFIMSLIIAYNLAFFLGGPETTWQWGMAAGALAGGGWAATGFVIIALFERRTGGYMLIHAGYLIVTFGLMGLIIGAWR